MVECRKLGAIPKDNETVRYLEWEHEVALKHLTAYVENDDPEQDESLLHQVENARLICRRLWLRLGRTIHPKLKFTPDDKYEI